MNLNVVVYYFSWLNDVVIAEYNCVKGNRIKCWFDELNANGY